MVNQGGSHNKPIISSFALLLLKIYLQTFIKRYVKMVTILIHHQVILIHLQAILIHHQPYHVLSCPHFNLKATHTMRIRITPMTHLH